MSMNGVDIFSLMRSRYNSFTNAEKKVADYVMNNKNKVIHKSITDLAHASDVGESSVFRFCRSLDLRGYQDFKIALAHNLTLENETPQLSGEITMDDTIEELSSKILNATVSALTETKNLLNNDDISRTVDLFIQANRIHFFGVGASLMTALEAKNKFIRITNKVECSIDTHLQIMSASLMTENDVAVIISYSGSTKDMIELAEVVKETGAKIISLTRFAKSPLTNYSDITLLSGANEGPLQGGSLTAKISQLYLLDLLYAEYFIRTDKESIENRESTARAVIDKLL